MNHQSIPGRKQSFTGVCHYCKKTGHKIANSFKREQVNNRQSNQTPRSNRSFSSSIFKKKRTDDKTDDHR